MQVNLGRANKFTRFDVRRRRFSMIGNLIEKVDEGAHAIHIEARFTQPESG